MLIELKVKILSSFNLISLFICLFPLFLIFRCSFLLYVLLLLLIFLGTLCLISLFCRKGIYIPRFLVYVNRVLINKFHTQMSY
jgi:hypothetical protein